MLGAAEFTFGVLVPDVVHSDGNDDQEHHTVWYSAQVGRSSTAARAGGP